MKPITSSLTQQQLNAISMAKSVAGESGEIAMTQLCKDGILSKSQLQLFAGYSGSLKALAIESFKQAITWVIMAAKSVVKDLFPDEEITLNGYRGEVKLYAVTDDGNYQTPFNAFGTGLDGFIFDHHEIEAFKDQHADKLGSDWTCTAFLIRLNDVLNIRCITVQPGGSLKEVTYPFATATEYIGHNNRRIAVRDLKIKP